MSGTESSTVTHDTRNCRQNGLITYLVVISYLSNERGERKMRQG